MMELTLLAPSTNLAFFGRAGCSANYYHVKTSTKMTINGEKNACILLSAHPAEKLANR